MDENTNNPSGEKKPDLQETAQKVGDQIQNAAEKAGHEAAKAFDEAKKTFGPGLKSFADKLKKSFKGEDEPKTPS